MDKGKIKAIVTKFSEKFAIIMLKKNRKFCRRGLTNLDKYIWDALQVLPRIIPNHTQRYLQCSYRPTLHSNSVLTLLCGESKESLCVISLCRHSSFTLSLDQSELLEVLLYALAYLSSSTRTRNDCTPVTQTRNCDLALDCKTENWGPWSECTTSTTSPTRRRKKNKIRTAVYGGIPCCSNEKIPDCIIDTEIESCRIPKGKL